MSQVVTLTSRETKKSRCPVHYDIEEEQPVYCPGKTLPSEQLIHMEEKHAAHNYHPLPVVFSRAKGVDVWDPEGKHYFDFLSAYSALNQGHCHPKIVDALKAQADRITLSSRAFYNEVFPRFAKYATEYFGYDMMLPMNGGAEAVETALKLARKWGYMKKKIPQYEGVIIACKGCFHGRTLAIISMSNDPSARDGFGPFIPGVVQVEYNNVESLKTALEQYGDRVCGFLVEPIQGEAGVVIPDDGYLKQCYELCKQHNVLFIADEIQTGLGRTGRLLASDWEGIRPDIVVLGKAISGGVLPLSAILADAEVMLCIQPGEHGSTYGGNPLASAVGIAALEVIKQEKLVEQAEKMGNKLMSVLRKFQEEFPFIKSVRGRGLFCAIEMDPEYTRTAWDVCIALKKNGLLAKPTHETIIRLAPPLVITESEMDECIKIIDKSLREIQSSEDVPKVNGHHA